MPDMQVPAEVERSQPGANLRLVFLLAAACTASLGGLLFGFDIAIITGAGPYLRMHFGLNDLSLG
ncbi:MAG TPA: hypothetical protein VK729_11445 [Silvibacterium sp.]|jgi:SP family arabinose:H+ symporter-like MFS transporter|nr:hypothetical protein [Silvibacterium sp.]